MALSPSCSRLWVMWVAWEEFREGVSLEGTEGVYLDLSSRFIEAPQTFLGLCGSYPSFVILTAF